LIHQSDIHAGVNLLHDHRVIKLCEVRNNVMCYVRWPAGAFSSARCSSRPLYR